MENGEKGEEGIWKRKRKNKKEKPLWGYCIVLYCIESIENVHDLICFIRQCVTCQGQRVAMHIQYRGGPSINAKV